jgi:hypothetical protein
MFPVNCMRMRLRANKIHDHKLTGISASSSTSVVQSQGGFGLRRVAAMAQAQSATVAMHRLICVAQFFKRNSPIALMISKRAVSSTSGAFARH